MNHVADTEIRSEIRSLLTRHRVDQQRLQVRITSGTVRVSGELAYHGSVVNGGLAPATIEALEHEVMRARGVKNAFFDLVNWRRLSTGEWQPAGLVGAAA